MRCLATSTARLLRQSRFSSPSCYTASVAFRKPLISRARFNCNMASQHSAACCSIPPVVTEGYEPKGKYTTIDGMKTYQTGPSDAKHAILIISDIFGFYPQTLQGADILAHSDKDRKYQIFIPDFFEGKPAHYSWYPPDTDDKKKKMGDFFAGPGAPGKTVHRVPKVVDEINSKISGIESWAILGFCWGGKIVNLTSTAGTKFKVAAIAHPAMLDPNDAPNITIPIIMLPSRGENKDDVVKWQQSLKVKNQVEWFNEQDHGFMAARGNLSDESNKAAYEHGYKLVLSFLHENL